MGSNILSLVSFVSGTAAGRLKAVHIQVYPLTEELRVKVWYLRIYNRSVVDFALSSGFVRGLFLLKLVNSLLTMVSQLVLIKMFYAIPDFFKHEFLREWIGLVCRALLQKRPISLRSLLIVAIP